MNKKEKIEIDEKQYWDSIEKRGMYKRTAKHPVVKFYAKQRFDYIKTKIDFNSIKNCLDVGSGTGFSSAHFPNQDILTCVDFSFRNMTINTAKNKIQASTYSLPFSSDSFDLVYGWEFLHHLDEPKKAVAEMARVTKKFLVLFEPNRINPGVLIYSLYDKRERRQLQYNRNKMIELAKFVDFEIVSCESVGWVFAGSSPTFSLKICKKMPYVNKFGGALALICKKRLNEN